MLKDSGCSKARTAQAAAAALGALGDPSGTRVSRLASLKGESASLYPSPPQGPLAAQPFTGFGLEQRPASARPIADSFLQIDRCASRHS